MAPCSEVSTCAAVGNRSSIFGARATSLYVNGVIFIFGYDRVYTFVGQQYMDEVASLT